jgi:hypothetical protein
MKFTQEHYDDLKKAVIAAIEKTGKSLAEIEAEYAAEKLTFTRFIWDLYWASHWNKTDDAENYYDKHIETAMKRIYNDLKN